MEYIISFFKNDIVIQLIGFVGMAFSVLYIQNKSYNGLIIFKICSELIFGFQFLLLGAYTGMMTSFVSCITNSIYKYRIKKGKSTLPFQIAFGILFVIIGIFTWDGLVSLYVIIAKLISTVSYGIKKPKIIRRLTLVIMPLWLCHDITVATITGAMNDILVITSTIIAIIRLDVIPVRRENKRLSNT